MAEELNWDDIEKNAGGDFKDYAPDGKYEAKLDSVDVREVGTNGSIAVEFILAEDDRYQYPKITHWLSFKNDNWRRWHFKQIFAVLGLTDEQAKKTIEVCEDKGDKDAIVKAYESAFKKVAQKHPSIELDVFTEHNDANDKDYARGEFRDSRVAMPHDSKPATEKVEETKTEDNGDITLSDLPF